MLRVKSFTFNLFFENSYLVWNEDKEALIIDPGCHTAAEKAKLGEFIAENGLKPVELLNTHCHLDHIYGNRWAKETYGIPFRIHPKDEPILLSADTWGAQMLMPQAGSPLPDGYLSDDEEIKLGRHTLKVMLTPGHAPGHVVFYHKEGGWVISGDLLFKSGVGRTDLPFGDWKALEKSIREKLYTLPHDTRVLSGHGPETTIREEKRSNVFVKG